MPKIRLLEVTGTPFELGHQHGLAYPKEIGVLTEDRLQLSSNKYWTGQELSRAEVLALAEACLPYHEAYAPELMEELRGLSAATGLSVVELVILNGFTDFIDVVYNAEAASLTTVPAHPALDDCTAFIVSPDVTAEGHGFYGQTWDMHETATPHVILLHGKPAGGLRFLTLTIIGCIGMIGMNEAGIAIGINNLVDRTGQVGVTWPFVIRKVLAQDNIDDALTCLTGARLAGGHNYMLIDGAGRGYNVEAMAAHHHVEEITTRAIAHTNHCLHPQTISLERARLPESKASSHQRLDRGQHLLNRSHLTLADLFALTRDHESGYGICAHPTAPFYVESCAAAIMRPATAEMWAVWGHPCENEYERFVV